MSSPLKLFLQEKKIIILGFFFLAITCVTTVLSPRVLARIVDEGIVPRNYAVLMHLLHLYAIVELSKLGSSALHTYVFSLAGQRLMHKLRNMLYYNFLKLPAGFYAKNSSSGILTRITNDIYNVGQLFQAGVLQAVENFITLSFIIIAFFLLDYRFALIALAPFPIVVAAALIGSKIMHRIFKSLYSQLQSFNSFLTESIGGIQIVHLFNAEETQSRAFQPLNLELKKAQRDTRLVFAFFHPLVTVSAALGIASLIYFGGKYVIAGEARVGVLVASISYVVWISWPVMTVIDKWNMFISGMVAYRRVVETINWELEDDLGDISLPAGKTEKIDGNIVFENVSFSYENGSKVLENFNLEIKKGENVGIVGPSGSGKSTIFNLLRRFYEPQSGRILIDGRDIKTFPKRELRSNLGLVQQDLFLFSGSIQENITFWDDSSPAAKDSAYDLISSSLNVAKQLSERGSNLSLGERQLISFLRCLSSNPQIWLLDEASASLDQQSEKRLFEILNRYSEGKSIVSIAHRVSTVRDADRIIVLNKGRIIEDGKHSMLIRNNGLYARLYNLQTSS
jgi:ATP-binding cassette subfamily B multidrug efflux pump